MSRQGQAARTELFWLTDRADRLRLAAELVMAAGSAVIMCRAPAEAVRVAASLSKSGVPAAAPGQAAFGSGQVRARIVTDETLRTVRPAPCLVHHDPPLSIRRYRRRIALGSANGGLVVCFVVPEWLPEMRRLSGALGLPEAPGPPDPDAARRILAGRRASPAEVPAAQQAGAQVSGWWRSHRPRGSRHR